MKVYTVLYHKKVERDLKKIPVPIRFTIEKAIYSLREFDKAKSILDIKTLK
jgi:mRNA-degrading endonuclease RelE of RelBE toxin-antitoxin system